jgi:hypothetical protein
MTFTDKIHIGSVTVVIGSNERIPELVMQIQKSIDTRRHVIARILVTTALLGSTFIVGLATTASAAPTDKLLIFTQPSSTDASGAALAQQPVIDVDTSGNTLDTSAEGTVTATITSGGVSVSGGSVAAVNGVATFTNLALNALVGNYTLTFSDATDSTSTVQSNTVGVTVGAAKALHLSNKASITGAVNTVALTPQPIVNVVDSGGNVVTSNVSTVTATFTSTGTSLTNASANTVAGVATFSGLTITAPIDTAIGGLTFTDGSLTPETTGSLAITGPATKLAFIVAPSTIDAAGVALAAQPVIAVEDASGAVVKADTSTVTAALVGGNAGSSIANNTKAAVSGEASFVGLAVDAAVGSYDITFSDGSLTPVTTTTPTTVTAGVASKLVIATEPSATAASGVALAQQPAVKVEDAGGNLVSSLSSGVVTASISSGVGGTLSAGSTATIVNGVATFSGLTLAGTPGSLYTLTYTGVSLSVVDTSQIKLLLPQAALTIPTVSAIHGRTYALVTSGGSGTGALSFTVTNGTATGCAITGTSLTSTSAGTCLVTATKASDTTYLAVSSVATAVTFYKLAIPGAVRLKFATNSAALLGAARVAIVALIKKLTVDSVVVVTGYAKGNSALARHRAQIAETYLIQRLHVRVQLHWSTKTATQGVIITTKSQ